MLLPRQMILSAIIVTKKESSNPKYILTYWGDLASLTKRKCVGFQKVPSGFWFVILGVETGIGGLCVPFKKTPPVILSLILWARTVANGQRSRRIAASRGLIQDYSDTFFSAVPSVPWHTLCERCSVARFPRSDKVEQNHDQT